MVLNVGDKIAVLDDDLVGVITLINKSDVVIETTEGFELTFAFDEVVKLSDEMINNAMFNTNIETVLKQKTTTKRSHNSRKKPKDRYKPTMEVDLHLHHLVANEKHLSNHDKKNIQLDTAKHKLEYAIKNKIQKIVFIHGVGEGVLKLELEYLFNRYDNIKFYDADYKKYGLGATEVYIFQNKK